MSISQGHRVNGSHRGRYCAALPLTQFVYLQKINWDCKAYCYTCLCATLQPLKHTIDFREMCFKNSN